MRTQKPISVRIDITSENWLNILSLEEGKPKNQLINEAVRMYIRLQQSKTRATMHQMLKKWELHAKEIDARGDAWK